MSHSPLLLCRVAAFDGSRGFQAPDRQQKIFSRRVATIKSDPRVPIASDFITPEKPLNRRYATAPTSGSGPGLESPGYHQQPLRGRGKRKARMPLLAFAFAHLAIHKASAQVADAP